MKSLTNKHKMHIKPEIRILALDDSPLLNDKITIIGTFFRGGVQIDGILRFEITKDGMDATDIFIRMIKGSKYYAQIRIIMLDGVTYAGFNPVDVNLLHKDTGKPVIVFMRSYPDFPQIEQALTHLYDAEKRWEMIRRAGMIQKIEQDSPVFFQVCGLDDESAARIIKSTSTHSNIPEPLRVAHLIATGVVLGESTGKA